MDLAYKLKDTFLGDIVNKTGIVTKKIIKGNQHSDNRYMYMSKNDGQKIKEFLDIDENRSKQIDKDVQVLKKAYLSDEVISKMKEEINEVFEKEYYSYTNRLYEYKNVLEDYRNYLDGIENRVRDYEKIALQTNTYLKQYVIVFQQYIEEINSYNELLDQYERRLEEYKFNHTNDKELLDNIEKMVNKTMTLDTKISNEVNRIMDRNTKEIERNNIEIRDFMEDEFTKIAAYNIKSRRKIDRMFAFLIVTNLLTIAGLVAMYFIK